MRTAYRLQELRALSDDELVAIHDEISQSTVVGLDYCLNGIQRRELSRQAQAAHRLSIVSGVLAAVAAVVAIIALLAG
jgi:hypothetical protein